MSTTTIETADGVRLHVEITESRARSGHAGPTVVLTHGWTLDSRSWAPVGAALLEPDGRAPGGWAPGGGGQAGRELGTPARVVCYDHRGHGRSDAAEPESMTLEQLADDLAHVIAATAPTGSLVLGGHSMGGMTIMALAERHPRLLERVAGVALVSTASGGLAGATLGLSPRQAQLFRAAERRLYSLRRWVRRSTVGNPRMLAPVLRWLLLGQDVDRAAVQITTQSIASCRPVTVAGFRPALDAHERDAALAAFASIPVVVLVGSRDRLTPVSSARRIAAVLPSAKLTIFPKAGHMLPVERVAGVENRIGDLVRNTIAAERSSADHGYDVADGSP
ncbi:MAG: alpha/beta fold hydrolase [Pseudonocardia sp.]